jgi:hypothetical protein
MRINRFTAGFRHVAAEVDDGQRQILDAYRDLTPAGVVGLPQLAFAAVSRFVLDELPVDGVTADQLDDDSRVRSRLTVGLLGSCQTALVVCSGDPTIAERSGIGIPHDPVVRDAFEAIAEGANELAAAGSEGLVHLVGQAGPPVVDGLVRFSSDPDRLAHHVVTWFLLALSLGMTGDVIDPDVQRGLAAAFPIEGPALG